jgi:aminoglycoside phosphotransferase family enzyme/predicted kinase
MVPSDALAAARQRVAGLRAHLEAKSGRPVRLVETHISWVLLGDAIAWKLKKPLQLPFLDFRTLAARCHYGREELRVNRRLAPWLYLDVVDVVETPAGPRLGGPGRVVDVALRMRRFADGALWSERVLRGELREADVDALAATLARFHAEAPSVPPGSALGGAPAHLRVVEQLLDALPAGAPDGPHLQRWLRDEAARLAGHFERRRASGRVRECHGDLHLANVVQAGDRPSPFDAIEFDEALRWIDPVEDVAFLVMDLLAYGAPALAWRFLNQWLEASGDHDGLPALRFFLVCRALVRAQVTALRAREDTGGDGTPPAATYRALAAALAHPGPARLAITHGLPGSGKTHTARRLAQGAGAVHLRSDVERKRLFGLAPLARSDAAVGLYAADATERTYRRLVELARGVLRAGWPVIVDAANLRRAERAAFAAVAKDAAVPFTIVDCVAARELLQARVRARLEGGRDASEADASVLERLAQVAEPLDDAERAGALVVDAALREDDAALLARWRAASGPR